MKVSYKQRGMVALVEGGGWVGKKIVTSEGEKGGTGYGAR